MVYLQPEQLGWWPLVQSWIATMSESVDNALLDHLHELFDSVVG